jgi:hypothetical protein
MSSPSTTISPTATPSWMGQVYSFLGLTVGVIVPNLSDHERREAYAATSPTARTTSSASIICATI